MVDPQRVFISYVREDSSLVDRLCKILESAQIPYWRDRTSLAPGDAWRAKIRDAIRSDALVFLACFSEQSRARTKSHMNEELTLAIEEFRKLPPGRTWLIPVRFDDGPVPDWDLGAGRALSDLNYADLFGASLPEQAAALVTTISRLMGSPRPDEATFEAAIAEAPSSARPSLLRRLTKEMLPDPARRIELDDLIREEGQATLTLLRDEGRFPTQRLPSADPDLAVTVVNQAAEIWKVFEPFCWSLQVAVRWADAAQLRAWATGLHTLAAEAVRSKAGVVALLELRHLPGVVAAMVTALAAVESGRWDNARALLVDTTVIDPYQDLPVPLIEVAGPWSPFTDAGDLTAQALARTAITGEDAVAALAHLRTGQANRYHTPVAEWLHHVLHPSFEDSYPDSDSYSDDFDHAEVMLGLISQDQALQRALADSDTWRTRSRWFGRSTWRSYYRRPDALARAESEFASQGADWQPLQGGLFGHDPQRVERALVAYREAFNRAWDSRA